MRNDVVNNIRLDINNQRNNAVVHVRAGDTKPRTIHFTITDRGTVKKLDDVVIALITITKPDGNHCYNDLVRQDNELHYSITTQTINVPGECSCEVELTFKDGTRIGIEGFTIMVYEKYLSDTYVESLNEYKAIPIQIALSEQYAESASASADKCAESEAGALKSAEDASAYANTANALLGEFRQDVGVALERLKELEEQCQALANECSETYQKLLGMGTLDLGTTHETAYYGDLGQIAYEHSQSTGNPHLVTYEDVGADAAGSAQAVYENLIAYIDMTIANLINGAPSTLDTLKEIADAMTEHVDVVEALEAAIGSKADATETTSLINQLDTRVNELEDSQGYPISR